MQSSEEILGKQAELFVNLPNGRVKCTACARYCEIPEGKTGLCGIRGVADNKLFLYVYGKVISGHIDPIEKKPVTHYRPGSTIYSIATTGCNWLCKYCQNYDISQRRKIEGIDMSPSQVARTAVENGADGIAYTYNEPSIFIEFARDCGVEARKRGLFNIFVSNGFDTPDSVNLMDQFLDCITVDFKGSGKQEFVRQYIGIPSADPVFETLKETPIHFLRFHPDYKMMNFGNTPVETLEKHHSIAKAEGLRYAYLGNVPGHPLEHTYCPDCNQIAIERYGYDILSWNLDKTNSCKKCGCRIPVIGSLKRSGKRGSSAFRIIQ
jgi:pyruvate formate lyase activating enzyme